MTRKVNIFWFRRDLRTEDNVGFSKGLQGAHPLLPIFIFDTEILQELSKDDARVSFLYSTLQKINTQLKLHGSGIAIYSGKPLDVFKKLAKTYDIQHVITNHDYEPYALNRDTEIESFLASKNCGYHSFKDQVIFEKDEIVKGDGSPYVVYTPYMKKWKATFRAATHLTFHAAKKYFGNLLQSDELPNTSLAEIGFTPSKIEVPDFDVTPSTIQEYENTRNFPALDSTSHLGPHLRFGTVSIRLMVSKAIAEQNEVFWQELIWREFFMHILWHFPRTVDTAFRKKYDRIQWRNNPKEFEKWKNGETGYLLIDAGMRELNETGYMHNRVRMVVASFLCKHLLIDWRWGEGYFAKKLLDYELSSNVGNWQWAAGSGVDAAPYFRIFNPMTQIDKFDKEHVYIKKWIPEYGTAAYPEPMVEHKEARLRCLTTYKEAVS